MKSQLISFLQRIQGWRLWLLTVVVCVILAEIIASALRLLLTGVLPGFTIVITAIAALIVASLVTFLLTFFLDSFAELREQTLQDSLLQVENRLSLAMEATNLILWEYDFAKDRLNYQDEMLTLLDMDRTDPPHSLQAWIARVHPDDVPLFVAQFQQAVSPAGNSRFDLEYRLAQCAQPWGWVHSTGRIVRRDASGQARMALGTTQDVTARKQATTDLRELKEKFELIFEYSPDAMLISRLPDGLITNVNEAFIAATGYSRDET